MDQATAHNEIEIYGLEEAEPKYVKSENVILNHGWRQKMQNKSKEMNENKETKEEERGQGKDNPARHVLNTSAVAQDVIVEVEPKTTIENIYVITLIAISYWLGRVFVRYCYSFSSDYVPPSQREDIAHIAKLLRLQQQQQLAVAQSGASAPIDWLDDSDS
ncbi:hypothetical protein RFI_09512 [Reticulomyxa filosa]|uniref:Uncharacterized protein n=1 Tax=Reticulomyxa filosa TaxID=46433 RepID=X6NMY2_RETFI|nr:hypothetical protein RFI_09512 [Reticulomyxa filosa]|eukprot:ETO27625.1 hypothetical protein RFI_09512 [Reticulomyxa filosa]